MGFRAEVVTIIPPMLCFFISIYLSILATETLDSQLREQLVNWSVYSLITGVVLAAVWIFYWMLLKAFSEKKSRREYPL